MRALLLPGLGIFVTPVQPGEGGMGEFQGNSDGGERGEGREKGITDPLRRQIPAPALLSSLKHSLQTQNHNKNQKLKKRKSSLSKPFVRNPDEARDGVTVLTGPVLPLLPRAAEQAREERGGKGQEAAGAGQGPALHRPRSRSRSRSRSRAPSGPFPANHARSVLLNKRKGGMLTFSHDASRGQGKREGRGKKKKKGIKKKN